MQLLIISRVGDEIACIDHHPDVNRAEYQYKDIRIVGSCATIIASYYKELDITPDEDVATSLLFGLKTDTLNFTRGVTVEDIDTYKYLFEYADIRKLTSLERNNIEFDDLKAYGTAIENIKVFGKLGISSIDYPCPDPLIAIISDFILALEEVEVSVIFSYRDDGIKFSVISENNNIHAGNLVKAALKDIGNGGGHAEMAGGLIGNEAAKTLGDFKDQHIIDRFLKECENVLDL